MESHINFIEEDAKFPLLKEENKLKAWIENIVHAFGFRISNVNYIFCSDDYLLEVNKTHLNHDYYTDIITFDLSEEENCIESDIFISIDRVIDNAKTHEESNETSELLRVLAHGILHLIGFNDKTEEQAQEMRAEENKCIAVFAQ